MSTIIYYLSRLCYELSVIGFSQSWQPGTEIRIDTEIKDCVYVGKGCVGWLAAAHDVVDDGDGYVVSDISWEVWLWLVDKSDSREMTIVDE